MFKTRSINAACYLSCVTGLIADVDDAKGNLNNFQFPKCDQIAEAYKVYKYATDNQTELIVDFTKINYYFRLYKQKTKVKKMTNK